MPARPIANVLRLCAGDIVAKTLNFLAFVYLARVLGVATYGVLEFAISSLTYFALLADGGLEMWATREVAQGRDAQALAVQVVPLRLLLATLSCLLLLALIPALPDYPALGYLLAGFSLTLFAQAASLKWALLGREQMARVGVGLAIAQVVFALAVFTWVRTPEHVSWIPAVRLCGDAVMAIYFWRLFRRIHGPLRLRLRVDHATAILVPALSIGASQALGLLSFNCDTLLLGFLRDAKEVGWYSAAYKPVTVMLALPITAFVALFPALSRTFVSQRQEFVQIVIRALRIAGVAALPVGVCGTFLAGPVIGLLFGPEYSPSVPATRLLCWAAVLVILRGTYRQALCASGHQRLDLMCAASATLVNVVLNLALIPWIGIQGAAIATVVSEVLWLSMSSWVFHHWVQPLVLVQLVWQSAVAALAMAIAFALVAPLFWVFQAAIALGVYSAALLVMGEPEVRSWTRAWIGRWRGRKPLPLDH